MSMFLFTAVFIHFEHTVRPSVIRVTLSSFKIFGQDTGFHYCSQKDKPIL